MTEVRRATAGDAEELVRLRGLLLGTMSGRDPEPEPASDGWQQVAVATLREQLAEPAGSWAAFVIDAPDRPGVLAACVVGVIERRLGGPGNPGGEIGYVFNVVTDPGYRRRGYSRAGMAALLDWYRQRKVRVIDLRATPEGEPLYRSLGFAPSDAPVMRLTGHS